MFTKCFKTLGLLNISIIIYKKRLINILYTMFLLKIFIKCLKNSSRNEGYTGNVFRTFIIKCLINSTHKTIKPHLLTMFCKCLL